MTKDTAERVFAQLVADGLDVELRARQTKDPAGQPVVEYHVRASRSGGQVGQAALQLAAAEGLSLASSDALLT